MRGSSNIFLIGSGLSIAYSIVGAQLIGAIDSEKWSIAVGLPVALLLGTFTFHKVIIHYQRSA
jgi:Na+-driven multidrug efflux pump